ncbi:DUF222 domain-containing protein [Mycobacterium sp. smrl_JER01]|uniref:HNH endonuclease signature motif containing protein n=1 Tax=Mycobacterium sp. smrl_JER01 TaxID=3402633 RepID=UPI003AC89FF3
MIEQVFEEAQRCRGAAEAVGAWARLENAAAARRLSAMADLLEDRLADKDSAERDQWCLDNWAAVSAEVAAAQSVSLGVASNELLDAWALRQRLPRVSEVFASGAISLRLVRSVVKRTRLIVDADAMAKVDVEVAAEIIGWGPQSAAKSDAAVDHWVDRFDPSAVVRSEGSARSRHVEVTRAQDGSGLCFVEAVLSAQDGELLDRRLDAMAGSVCTRDPRTLDQLRSDALGALADKADRLVCQCGLADCVAAQRTPSSVVVHVIAEESSLSDSTPVLVHGEKPVGSAKDRHLLAPPIPTGPAQTKPAVIIGGALLPGPLVTATLAVTAVIRRLVHPGQSPPEPRHLPSRKLADFVRCRDMTCRFPGCDVPADRCDIDHTIAYPAGPTQASNLKALCRKHHLLKTFWGWRDVQVPDGTLQWTSPGGQIFTTHPGSRVLFPALCRPTAPVVVEPGSPEKGTRPTGLGMPRRTRTRAQDRARHIADQRRENEALGEVCGSPGEDCDDPLF